MSMRVTSAATWARWALWGALAFSGVAMAQAEPSLDQVYQAAQSGQVGKAIEMMQPVLQAHPASGKAHYVQAELLARQGLASQARDQLAQAERLAPGLPFAKPESVQSLRRALAMPQGSQAPERTHLSPIGAQPAPTSRSSMPWGVLLAVGGGALVAWGVMRLGKPAAGASAASAGAAMVPTAPAAMSGTGSPWSAPGMVPTLSTGLPTNMGASMAPTPAAAGWGRQVAGGLATGLAVGAGVMAAESIGKSLFGGPAHAAPVAGPAPGNAGAYDPVFGNTAVNAEMGGNDFGINDVGSWDDGAAGAGSSDWDT